VKSNHKNNLKIKHKTLAKQNILCYTRSIEKVIKIKQKEVLKNETTQNIRKHD
jgi:hypothetical protein